MTGLIWKDFMVSKRTVKAYLGIMIFYAALTVMGMFSVTFVTAFVSVMLIMLPISAFAYDEQAKWDRYAMSLPMGRRGVVRARYLFVLVLALLTMALGLAGTGLLYLVRQADPLEMFITLMVSSAIGLIIPAILLPLSYKLGAERARPYLYAIIFIPVIAVVLLAKAGVLDMSMLKGMDLLAPTALAGGSALLPLAGLALLFVSYLISCRVAAGKDF